MAWVLTDDRGQLAPVANNWFQTRADAKYAADFYAQPDAYDPGQRPGPRYRVANAADLGLK